MSKEDYTIPIRKYTELGEVTVKECVLKEEYDKLQERIDKAIEFIKEHNIVGMNKEYLPRGYVCCYSGELMEILKGDNDE